MKKEKKVAPLNGALVDTKVVSATEAFYLAIIDMMRVQQLQNNLPWYAKMTAQQKSFVATAFRNFQRTQGALEEALGVSSPEAIAAVMKAAITPKTKHRVPFVAPEMEDDWDTVGERLEAMATKRAELKREKKSPSHPRCSVCSSRHCGWDEPRNSNWGRPSKPSKARK